MRQIAEQSVDVAGLEETLMQRKLAANQVEALSGVIQRLMERDSSARSRTAAEALAGLYEAVDLPLPGKRAELRESYPQAAPFVGRQEELSRLKQAVVEAGAFLRFWQAGVQRFDELKGIDWELVKYGRRDDQSAVGRGKKWR